MTHECLQLIVTVLKPKQEVEEVMEEDRKEGEEEEEEGSEGGDSSSGGSSDDKEGEEPGGVDPAFAEEVRRALGAAAATGSDGEVGVSYLC